MFVSEKILIADAVGDYISSLENGYGEDFPAGFGMDISREEISIRYGLTG